MHPLLPSLAFTSIELTMPAGFKEDPHLVDEAFADPRSLRVQTARGRVLVSHENTHNWQLYHGPSVADGDRSEWILLGVTTDQAARHAIGREATAAWGGGRPVFGRHHPSAHGTTGLGATDGVGGRADTAAGEVTWEDLRELPGRCRDAHAAAAATTAILGNWHERSRFCGRCGSPSQAVLAGWQRWCPQCEGLEFPRVEPAVIMAVIDTDDRLLLAQGRGWPADRWSTVAGFVEPGEALENAVRRETYEETGVHVGDVTYVASQPWPFPGSLMCGFLAHATSADITVDDVEVVRARWFTRAAYAANLRDGSLRKGSDVSISRRLIEHWFGSNLDDIHG